MASEPIDDGGPAFPNVDHMGDGLEGMSLRDWFAGQALAGFCAHPTLGINLKGPLMAEDAYTVADSMLSARKVKP